MGMASLDGLYPYPTGWYAVAFSTELAHGELRTVHYFGKDIVLYRTAAGEAVAIEPYCPHLGAHLGHGGVVDGDAVQCPYHGWRFGPDGACVAVPGCDTLPKQAKLTRYPAVEQDDVICVFHDAEETHGEPFDFPALGQAGFTDAQTIEWTLRTHPQEVCENTVDMAHLRPIHSVEGAHVVKKPHIDGSHMNVVLEFVAPGDLIGMPGEDNDVQLDVILHGLGRIVARTHVKNRGVRARQAIYCTPIDGEKIHLRGVVNTMVTDDPEFTKSLSELFYESFVDDFAKDFPIWENKRYVARPRLSAADGPIGLYRRWVKQFYPKTHSKLHGDERPQSSVREPSVLSKLTARVRDVVERVDARRRELELYPRRAVPERRTQEAASATPVASAEEYFDTLPARFEPAGSRGVDAVFQWKLSGDESIDRYVVVRDGKMDLHTGEHQSPTVTIAMDAGDYVRMVNREIDGAWAFTSGRAKLSGSIPLAMRMRQIFPQ